MTGRLGSAAASAVGLIVPRSVIGGCVRFGRRRVGNDPADAAVTFAAIVRRSVEARS